MKSEREPERHLSLAQILDARARIRHNTNLTPVMTSETLDSVAAAHLYFKCENLQKVGAFKARGATNAVLSLTSEEARSGVVTHSSGNHAAALARAAKQRGIHADIVMPNNAPKSKIESVRRYGGTVIFCEPTLQARESAARKIVDRTGAAFVHPYNDWHVMAGQGTTAIELMEQVPDLEIILCPVGGGGLLGGIATAARSLKPSIQVIGVEPATADDAARSLRAGQIIQSTNPATLADGLLTSMGEQPFVQIRRYVHDIVTVSEDAIVQSMRLIWEVMKQIVEPSGAVSYAAVVEGRVDIRGKRVALILSGGNLDLDRLPWQSLETS